MLRYPHFSCNFIWFSTHHAETLWITRSWFGETPASIFNQTSTFSPFNPQNAPSICASWCAISHLFIAARSLFSPSFAVQMEALHSFLSEELLHSGIHLPVQYMVHSEVLLHTVLHRFPPELGMLLLWLYHRYHRLQYPAAFQEAESDLSVRYQVLNFCDILMHSVCDYLHYSIRSGLAVRRILSCRFQLLPEVLPVPQQRYIDNVFRKWCVFHLF